jgi:hypothetical protein
MDKDCNHTCLTAPPAVPKSLFQEEASIIINGMKVTAYSVGIVRRFCFQPHVMASVRPRGITAPHTPNLRPVLYRSGLCSMSTEERTVVKIDRHEMYRAFENGLCLEQGARRI